MCRCCIGFAGNSGVPVTMETKDGWRKLPSFVFAITWRPEYHARACHRSFRDYTAKPSSITKDRGTFGTATLQLPKAQLKGP